MVGKRLHGGGTAGEQNPDAVLPCLVGIIGLGIPGHVSHAEQGNLGGLRLVHRIGSKPLHERHRVRIHAIGAPQEQGVAHVIRHREIPPDERRPLQILVDPLQGRGPDIAHDAGPGPHDADVLVQMFPHHLVVAATSAGIRRGAHDQRSHVWLLVDKLLVQVIQELHLAFRFGALPADVVKKHGKGAEPQVIHHLKLLHGGFPVRLPPVNVRSGVHRPDKIHLVLLRDLHQLFQVLRHVRGIRLAPTLGKTVEHVVLRAVDVSIHLVLPVKLELADASFLPPGQAVKAFNGAAEGNVRPVQNLHHRHRYAGRSLLRQLKQRLGRVKQAFVVIARHPDALLRDAQGISPGLLRNIPGGLFASLDDGHLHGQPVRSDGKHALQRIHGRFVPRSRQLQGRNRHGTAAPGHLLRDGIHRHLGRFFGAGGRRRGGRGRRRGLGEHRKGKAGSQRRNRHHGSEGNQVHMCKSKKPVQDKSTKLRTNRPTSNRALPVCQITSPHSGSCLFRG